MLNQTGDILQQYLCISETTYCASNCDIQKSNTFRTISLISRKIYSTKWIQWKQNERIHERNCTKGNARKQCGKKGMGGCEEGVQFSARKFRGGICIANIDVMNSCHNKSYKTKTFYKSLYIKKKHSSQRMHIFYSIFLILFNDCLCTGNTFPYSHTRCYAYYGHFSHDIYSYSSQPYIQRVLKLISFWKIYRCISSYPISLTRDFWTYLV